MSRQPDVIFAARFTQALKADGRTSEQFARDTGFTLRTVTRWRSGDSSPYGDSLVRLAQALGREPAWFYEDPNGEPAEAVA